jgi:hypothetical protein
MLSFFSSIASVGVVVSGNRGRFCVMSLLSELSDERSKGGHRIATDGEVK